jgi:hypothetical protein
VTYEAVVQDAAPVALLFDTVRAHELTCWWWDQPRRDINE